jgi:hypothetical protein
MSIRQEIEDGKTSALEKLSQGRPLPTHDKTEPEVDPVRTFAKVTAIFLEDWSDKRLTADEVCDTLLNAAIARNLVRPNLKKLTEEELDKLLANSRERTTGSSEDKP